eukprot:705638-Amphidinium_carterae.2
MLLQLSVDAEGVERAKILTSYLKATRRRKQRSDSPGEWSRACLSRCYGNIVTQHHAQQVFRGAGAEADIRACSCVILHNMFMVACAQSRTNNAVK